MSAEATAILGVEDQVNMSDGSNAETSEVSWDQELFDLVAANADVLVESPRMPGVELPLGAVICLCQARITSENVHLFVAEVRQLLANAAAKTEVAAKEEEPAETQEPDQPAQNEAGKSEGKEVAVKTPDQPPQANASKDNSGNPDKQNVEAGPPQAFNAADSSPAKTPSTTVAPGPQASRTTSETISGSSSGIGNHETIGASTSAAVVENLRANSTDNVAKPAADTKIQLAPESPQAEARSEAAAETKPAPETDSPAASQGTEVFFPVADSETSADSEITLQPFLKDAEPGPAEVTQLEAEVIEPETDEPEVIYPQALPDEISNFIEGEEIVLDHFAEAEIPQEVADMQIPEIDYLQDEPGMAAPEVDSFQEVADIQVLESFEDTLDAPDAPQTSYLGGYASPFSQETVTFLESQAEISVPVEEVEDTLSQLAEQIEAGEPKTSGRINETLGEIIEVAASFEADERDIHDETEVQKELEVLFSRLLDEAGFGYTAELVESLARLTLKCHLVDEIESLRAKEQEADQAPQKEGTHEILKKLLIGLNDIKRAMAHACTIGKSALRLYSLSFAA